jgi:hypothetical protein
MKIKDKNGRVIEITFQLNQLRVTARYNDKEIGYFEFEKNNGNYKLKYADLEEDFLRKGIGTALLIESLSTLQQFELPKPQSTRLPGDGDFLTIGAEQFFASCQKNNICKLNGRMISL